MPLERPPTPPDPEQNKPELRAVRELEVGASVLADGIETTITDKITQPTGEITLKLASGEVMSVENEDEDIEVPRS